MLQKTAAPAWMRQYVAGKLSPASVSRIAQSMAPGTFRTAGNLGRGQFNLADEVVGNVGGFAGPMVRKLPTQLPYSQLYGKTLTEATALPHLATDAIGLPAVGSPTKAMAREAVSPADYYRDLLGVTDELNLRHGQSGAEPIVPIHDVNDKGLFQQLADRFGPKVNRPEVLDRQLSDVHGANVSPRNQIMDLTARPGARWESRVPGNDPVAGRIDPGTLYSPELGAGYIDRVANLPKLLKEMSPGVRSVVDRSNNTIRRYWGSPENRLDTLARAAAAAPTRRAELTAAIQAVRPAYDRAMFIGQWPAFMQPLIKWLTPVAKAAMLLKSAPYKSVAQQGYFHANAKVLEDQGVDIKEWDSSTDFAKLPKRIGKKPRKKSAGDTDMDVIELIVKIASESRQEKAAGLLPQGLLNNLRRLITSNVNVPKEWTKAHPTSHLVKFPSGLLNMPLPDPRGYALDMAGKLMGQRAAKVPSPAGNIGMMPAQMQKMLAELKQRASRGGYGARSDLPGQLSAADHAAELAAGVPSQVPKSFVKIMPSRVRPSGLPPAT